MRVRFRLAEILKEYREVGRGTIKRICTETGLERHQVSSLLKNQIQYLSLDALGSICDYLIKSHHLDPRELPGRLFSLEPDDFWAFISSKQLLVTSFGVRQEMHDFGVLWVPAADSYLQGMMLHELYGTEPPPPVHEAEVKAKDDTLVDENLPPDHHAGGDVQVSAEAGPRFDQYMVLSCSTQPGLPDEQWQEELEQMKQDSTRAYTKFHEIAGSKVLICLGSVKSNGLCELVISKAFSREAWIPEEGLKNSADRACPFYFYYRDKDLNVPSCHGGRDLAEEHPEVDWSSTDPSGLDAGIYFEREPGVWDGVPSNQDREPALIFISFRPATGVVEVVLGGFSTQGTFLLAEHFHKVVADIWPAKHQTPMRETAAFIVDFKLKSKDSESITDPVMELGHKIRQLDKFEVIPLPEEVLAHRISDSDS